MVINILHSIGDILFCEPIYRHYWEKEGVKPTVVIRDHLLYLQDYIESASFIGASKWNGNIDDMEMRPGYLPLRFANQIMRGLGPHEHHDFENTMPDKYVLAGLPVEMWKDMQFMFYPERSGALFSHLGIHGKSKYILVNERSQAGNIDLSGIENKEGWQVIKMHDVPGINVMDWAMVMLLAHENHHVSTSTFYVMQALKGYKKKFYVYARPNEDGLKGISKLEPDFDLVRVIS